MSMESLRRETPRSSVVGTVTPAIVELPAPIANCDKNQNISRVVSRQEALCTEDGSDRIHKPA